MSARDFALLRAKMQDALGKSGFLPGMSSAVVDVTTGPQQPGTSPATSAPEVLTSAAHAPKTSLLSFPLCPIIILIVLSALTPNASAWSANETRQLTPQSQPINAPSLLFQDTRPACETDPPNRELKNRTALIALEIAIGNVDEALREFRADDIKQDLYVIPCIVREAYKNRDAAKNILDWIMQLEYLTHRAVAYEQLLMAMRRQDNLTSLNVLSLDHDVQITLESNKFSTLAPHYKFILINVNNSLAGPTQEVIDAISRQIRNDDYEPIISYSRTSLLFEEYTNRIVAATYLRDDKTPLQLVKLANHLPSMSHTAGVLTALFDQMEKAKLVTVQIAFKIANKVKQLMETEEYLNTPKNVQETLQDLRKKLPGSVQTVMWEQVWIKNDELSLYLYEKGQFDDHRRKVSVSADLELNYRWKLQYVDEENAFLIRNANTYEYLYAADDVFNFDPHKRRIFTWHSMQPVFKGVWELEEHQLASGKWLIRNKYFNEYLNAKQEKNKFLSFSRLSQ